MNKKRISKIKELVKRNFSRFLNKNLPKDVLVNVNGFKMYANTIDRILALYLWKFSAYKKFEKALIKKIAGNRMIALDIGANIGYYSLIFSKLVGDEGKVYAFEPEPENYRLLVKNIKANNCKNIMPIQKAVSDKLEEIELFISEIHHGNHKIYDINDGRKAIKVEATTIDNEKISPNIVKMDVEGAEPLVFSGMKKTLNSKKKMVMLSEFWASAIKKCGKSPESFLEDIERYNFNLNYINKNKIKKTNPEELMGICSGNKHVNLFLTR